MKDFQDEEVGDIKTNLRNANSLHIEGIGNPPMDGYHIVKTNNGRIGVLRFEKRGEISWDKMFFSTKEGLITISFSQSVYRTNYKVLLGNKLILEKIDEGIKNYSILKTPTEKIMHLKSKIMSIHLDWTITDNQNKIFLNIKHIKGARQSVIFHIDPPITSVVPLVYGIIALLLYKTLSYYEPDKYVVVST